MKQQREISAIIYPWEFLCVINHSDLNRKKFSSGHRASVLELLMATIFFTTKLRERSFKVNNYNEFHGYMGLSEVSTGLPGILLT